MKHNKNKNNKPKVKHNKNKNNKTKVQHNKNRSKNKRQKEEIALPQYL